MGTVSRPSSPRYRSSCIIRSKDVPGNSLPQSCYVILYVGDLICGMIDRVFSHPPLDHWPSWETEFLVLTKHGGILSRLIDRPCEFFISTRVSTFSDPRFDFQKIFIWSHCLFFLMLVSILFINLFRILLLLFEDTSFPIT